MYAARTELHRNCTNHRRAGRPSDAAVLFLLTVECIAEMQLWLATCRDVCALAVGTINTNTDRISSAGSLWTHSAPI